MKSKNTFNRRQFLSTAAIAGAGAVVAGGTALTSCGEHAADPKKPVRTPIERLKAYRIPTLTDKAVAGRELKVGLVGCGGQGTGDLIKTTKAADGITIVALGDVLPDKLNGARERVKKETGQDVPAENCFLGFDAYKKVIDLVDVVLLVTPPVFRPEHFEYAVQAGKHVFMEKPICVDAAGAAKLLASAKIADTKKLCVCTGTQRRHQRSYVETFKQVADGAIGEITGGAVYWNQSQLWYKNRETGWSDMEWMIRDWVNWTWLSGDHIVEQHVHNIDVFNWFSGLKVVSGYGMGARLRRITGNQYDMFCVEFEYENGVRMQSQCRQINGCEDNVSEFIQGTAGSAYLYQWDKAVIKDLQGNEVWKWDNEQEKRDFKQTDAYVLEFVDLFTAIRENKPFNETEATTHSSLQAVIGRESAYTGRRVTMSQIREQNANLLPADLKMGSMDLTQTIPVPGK